MASFRRGLAVLALIPPLTACVRQGVLPTGVVTEVVVTASPTPKAEPTPVVVAPTPSPSPSAVPAASTCPRLLGIKLAIFAAQPERNRVVLDSTPVTDQCSTFPGRLTCPLGQEGTARRAECEAVRIGAEGPEWSITPYGQASVSALPGGGYLAEVFGHGWVTACSRVQPDNCAGIEIR